MVEGTVRRACTYIKYKICKLTVIFFAVPVMYTEIMVRRGQGLLACDLVAHRVVDLWGGSCVSSPGGAAWICAAVQPVLSEAIL